MKKLNYLKTDDGRVKVVPKDLNKLLNLRYLKLTNLTHSAGRFSLPALYCRPQVLPDFLALYNEPGLYHKTPLTCVCFYLYDYVFDGQNGLYNAIYYNNEKQLAEFNQRFSGVNFFTTPDYSQFGDLDEAENIHRHKKARVVAIWLTMELGAVVIPHITFASLSDLEYSLDGLEECSTVAFSTKGCVQNPVERNVQRLAIRRMVDRLNLANIIVYDVCETNDIVDDLFDYARVHGVNVVVPHNTLKDRNVLKGRVRHARL